MHARSNVSLVALFTDFGRNGPYVGQMQAVLALQAPETPVVELLSTAPSFRPRPAAYLLAALASNMPEGALFLGVVDPGVGGERRGVIVRTERHWFVGPDNGLLALSARRAEAAECRYIRWQPPILSSSFHGRDWFAPVAASICRGEPLASESAAPEGLVGWDWPMDLSEVVYIDDYGNAFTGLRAQDLDRASVLHLAGAEIRYARTFSAVKPGTPFWYENSSGLVEIAVSGGSAQRMLGLEVGAPVRLELS